MSEPNDEAPWIKGERLLAALPVMLEALKTAERQLLDGVAREKVRAAIALAEGRT